MSRRVGGNSCNGAGGWCVNRQHFAATASEWLTAQHFIPDANTQLTFSANMLLQRNDKSLRQWHLA